MSETSAFRLWISVSRAPDVRGAWLAHCLDLDVMAQSDSLAHAFDDVRAAAGFLLADDLRAGRDPLATRATAPAAAWAELWRVIDLAEKRPRRTRPGPPGAGDGLRRAVRGPCAAGFTRQACRDQAAEEAAGRSAARTGDLRAARDGVGCARSVPRHRSRAAKARDHGRGTAPWVAIGSSPMLRGRAR